MNSTIVILTIAIAAAIAVVLIVLGVKVVGDARYYKQMFENEVKISMKIWDDYMKIWDKYMALRKHANLDTKVAAEGCAIGRA